MKALVIDKGCLCNSIYHYPVNMYFFTTPELLEIGDLPLVCAAEKPTRTEALKYYRKAAEHYGLELRLYETVLRMDGGDGGDFTLVTKTEKGSEKKYTSKKVVIATGYYDLPNVMGVPGEDLPHVSHYYTEPHEFWGQEVVVIGGKNSAAEAALDLYRNGARVTLVHRNAELGSTIKYWVRPDIENRIKAGQVAAMFNTQVKKITVDEVIVQNGGGEKRSSGAAGFRTDGISPGFCVHRKLWCETRRRDEKACARPRNAGEQHSGTVFGGSRNRWHVTPARYLSKMAGFTENRLLAR